MICIVHCLVTPAFIFVMPVVAEVFVHAWFHTLVILLVFPVAVWALVRGYLIHHHVYVLVLGVLGLICVALAFIWGHHSQNLETLFMVIAGAFLSLAHFLNLRAIRSRAALTTLNPP